MIKHMLLVVVSLTALSGCPISLLGQTTKPPPVAVNITPKYPKLLKLPDVEDYVNPHLHIDSVGLEEYRTALMQYRAYLDRHETYITSTYHLSNKPVDESKIVYITKETKVPSVGCDKTCPVTEPTTIVKRFKPLIPAPTPVFKRDVDGDADIIDRLVEHIVELHSAINLHNEQHINR